MKKRCMILFAIVLAVSLFGCSNTEASVSQPDIVESSSAASSSTVSEAPESKAPSEASSSKPEYKSINVTSETLTADGKWLSVINAKSANPPGSNLSPQISWEPVDGAACYAIYMVDNSARHWLHWLAMNLQVTSLDLGVGEELEGSRYAGPYPPSGTHEYEVIVYALKTIPEKYPGIFDSNLLSVDKIEEKLDVIDGVPGNIIAKGSVKGTVTVGEPVE